MSLSEQEVQAVRDTWAIVAKDIKGNSIVVFLNFFKTFPEYQKLFKGFANVPIEELPENKRFKAHAFTVVSAINGMMDNLDEPEMLGELLIKTGQNHERRSIKLSDFKNLFQSLMELFAKIFGDAWTPAAESGWKKVFALMTDRVEQGLKTPE